ncbi:CRISPR-associated protein Cas5 family [Methanosalsum zhilinae DSM 4017]|uniref:CRISPR-associated protein Cas5 family n=1 Tax=Methanosalsum zhilinae (strain DSM 4017 / NBRC 107636 / OCM 62 / WeN5) TaxID=679901 RepID=F7XPH2_METZD|nr:type I-E CRISPR-associated protein Cas5/CasD [Methanosalsum zhilinae]AEH61397.1 CRISPR-associated protein Cas5 family [Methanosalsum zhilinae DSM 4017]
MKDYLIFRIYAPIASWGDIAIGTHRPTFDHPSKSAIFGLLAAALGIDRDDDEAHLKLNSSYNYGVLVNSHGNMLRDYHTSQVPGKSKKTHSSRKEELETDDNNLNTIISTRDYYSDCLYTIILSSKSEEPPYPFSMLIDKLNNPSFNLYLGRKSCPLSLPLDPKVVSASNMKEALLITDFRDRIFIPELNSSQNCRFYWEDPDENIDSDQVISKYDEILSRKRWQFSRRNEYYAMVNMEN